MLQIIFRFLLLLSTWKLLFNISNIILLFWSIRCCRKLFWFNRKEFWFYNKINFCLYNNNKFLASIFPAKLRFTSVTRSKLNDNSLEFFPSLSPLIKLALFKKLLDWWRPPLFKELLAVGDSGIANKGIFKYGWCQRVYTIHVDIWYRY